MPADQSVSQQRMRWTSDTSYTLIQGGVLFRNDCRMMFFRGEKVIAWTSLLAASLDGENPAEDICSRVPGNEREQLLAFIHALKAERFLETPQFLPDAALLREFRRPMEFLGHLAEDSAERFSAFRNGKLLLVGSGIPLQLCASTLLRSGLKQLHILPLAGGEQLESAEAAAQELRSKGIEAQVVVLAWPQAIDKLPEFDLVAYCSDRVRLADILRIGRACDKCRRPFLPGIAVSNCSLMGPVIRHGSRGCWVCGLRRIAPYLEEIPQAAGFLNANREQDAASDPIDESTSTELGTDMAFTIFKILAGNLRPDTDTAMLVQKRESEIAFAARMVPQPLCACMGYCERYAVS
jgi:hypothetical protein